MRVRNRRTGLATAYFALCAAMTLLYLVLGYGVYLDSDMSSELVLAEHLAKGVLPFSGEWYYSTEVRLINTQLVFTPLMRIPGISFRLVRTVGCVILLAMLAGASLFAAKKMGADDALALVFSGMEISLCSPLYAQNVIIGAYYIPHAVLMLLMAGMYANWLRRGGRMRAGALLALAFVMGLSSIRYLLCTLLPIALAAAWMYVFPSEGQNLPRTRKQNGEFALGIGIAAMGAVGYVAGKKCLPKLFHINVEYYEGTTYADWQRHDLFEQMQDVLGGLLEAMGFEGGVPIFGVQGCINALVLAILLLGFLLLTRRELAQGARREKAAGFGRLMFVFSFGISLATFVLLRGVYFSRYWLPVLMLGAPVLAACLTRTNHRLFAWATALLFAGTVLLTSASCAYYSLKNPQVRSEMRMEAVQKADELGLTQGYATFWNANILTELTDGRIDMTSVELTDGADGTSLALRRWLEAEDELNMNEPDEPVFLLLGTWEDDGLSGFLEKAQAQKIEIPGDIQFYVIPSQRLLFDAMGATQG